MLDFFLTAGVALFLGQLAPSSPWPTAMAAIGLVVIGWRRLSMTQTVVLFFFFALAAYRAGSMLNQYDEARVAAW
ncbi:MAG TPA: hypothetical protein PK710_19415, partial [Polyangiaceae bacterium]|nr:hypothetical protein [Polyangiaceae bacterium]